VCPLRSPRRVSSSSPTSSLLGLCRDANQVSGQIPGPMLLQEPGLRKWERSRCIASRMRGSRCTPAYIGMCSSTTNPPPGQEEKEWLGGRGSRKCPTCANPGRVSKPPDNGTRRRQPALVSRPREWQVLSRRQGRTSIGKGRKSRADARRHKRQMLKSKQASRPTVLQLRSVIPKDGSRYIGVPRRFKE
jgi:hypothetical protein